MHPFRSRLAASAALLTALAVSPPAVDARQQPAEPDSVAEPAEGIDYLVYDGSGDPSSLGAILRAAAGADVLLVGEEHDDMVGHALEARLFEGAIAQLGGTRSEPGRTVVLSLEMFERDVQYVLDEYLAGLVTEEHFLESARPWDDYEARYRALVEAARDHGGPVVAANAPRRYVNRVTREGPASLASLSEHAKSFLPPLPYPGPSARYRAQWDALMTQAMGAQPAQHAPPDNAIHAQALWDAAMGHAITAALVEHLGALVVHFAGSFHVAHGTGIPERIEDYRPGTRVVTVVMTKVDDVGAWAEDEHEGLAEFVVLTKRPGPVTDER